MRVFFVLIFGVFLAASIQTQAQPLFPHANSIETTVANADLVFIGTIARFQSPEHGDAPEGRDAGMVIEQILKMDLQEEPYKRLGIFIPGADSVLGDWMKRSCRLLVAYDETAPKASTVIELTQDKVEVMTADCRLLRDPEAVVQAAKETVRRMPRAVKRIHTFKLKVAREAITGTRWERYYDTGGHLVLSVPADEKLETKALECIRSESYEERRKGVQALWFFKTQENVLRIKAMLADPGTSVFYDGRPDENTDIETTYYGVRSAAYSVLACWGLTCEKPVIFEKSPK